MRLDEGGASDVQNQGDVDDDGGDDDGDGDVDDDDDDVSDTYLTCI